MLMYDEKHLRNYDPGMAIVQCSLHFKAVVYRGIIRIVQALSSGRLVHFVVGLANPRCIRVWKSSNNTVEHGVRDICYNKVCHGNLGT